MGVIPVFHCFMMMILEVEGMHAEVHTNQQGMSWRYSLIM